MEFIQIDLEKLLENPFNYFINNPIFIYIILIIIGIFILNRISTYFFRKKAFESEIGKLISLHKGQIFTEIQKRNFALGAILGHASGETILSLIPSYSLDDRKNGLENAWGITDHESAIETIKDLLDLKRSSGFDRLFQTENDEIIEAQKLISENFKISLDEVEKVKTTFAWDISRASSMAKWCYWCDFISEDEMWNFMKKAGKVAEIKGTNWQDFMISFFLGRIIHGFGIEDLFPEVEELYFGKNLSFGKTENVDIYKTLKFK